MIRSLPQTFLWVTAGLFAARFLVQCATPEALGPALQSAPVRSSTPPRSPSNASALRGSEAQLTGSVHVALGIPHDADPADDFYLDERAFALSYNPSKRVANWVAWRLERADFGDAKRKDDFRPDPLLPARFYRVNASDYRHSGYDRGHLCPSADRGRTAAENSRTFVFTNLQPQLHELNAGPWEQLERYARERARRGDVLYSVAGGIFGAPYPTIGKGVAVPAASFKIIVFLQPGQGAADVTDQSEVLAASMPNQAGVGGHDWHEYVTTVDAIEQATGYDFLSAVPEHVQRVIEARVAPE